MFTQIPSDIIRTEIVQKLSITDLINLKQCNKLFHEIVTAEYIMNLITNEFLTGACSENNLVVITFYLNNISPDKFLERLCYLIQYADTYDLPKIYMHLVIRRCNYIAANTKISENDLKNYNYELVDYYESLCHHRDNYEANHDYDIRDYIREFVLILTKYKVLCHDEIYNYAEIVSYRNIFKK